MQLIGPLRYCLIFSPFIYSLTREEENCSLDTLQNSWEGVVQEINAKEINIPRNTETINNIDLGL